MRYYSACAWLASLGLFLISGCGGKEKPTPSPTAKVSPADKGTILLAEPNEKYHMRLKIVKDEKKAQVEILDEKVENLVGIEEESITLIVKDAKPVMIKLAASGKGMKTSRFAGEHARLAEPIDADKIEITATIAGKEYRFVEDDHH